MRLTTRSLALLLGFALAACACPEKKVQSGPTPTPTPSPTPSPEPSPPPAAALPDKPGDKCADDGCGNGLTCVRYYGIAGPNGPEFRSCELPCPTPADKCPDGTTCTQIADGPGRVCR